MITDRNLAAEYAQVWQLAPQQPSESGAQFRERVARMLAHAGHPRYAHEALFNEVMPHDPFAHGPLDRGYGPEFISHMARQTEATLVAAQGSSTPSGWLRSLRGCFGCL